jgi:hypothetical protein
MAEQYVDPERFKRFQRFLQRHFSAFIDAAGRAFANRGPGVLIYRPHDDRFEGNVPVLSFEYKTRAEIEAAQAGERDELIQGMLERYQPPGEALLVAIYPDKSYDISRVVVRRTGGPGGEAPGAPTPTPSQPN